MLPTSMLPCLHAILAACCDLSEDPLTFGETFQFPAVYKNEIPLGNKNKKRPQIFTSTTGDSLKGCYGKSLLTSIVI